MTITKHKKKNGELVYKTQVYLGIDSITGKKAMTTVTAPTKKLVKAKVTQAKADFVSNGYTLKQIRRVTTFEELASLWWESYESTVKISTKITLEHILRNHILPAVGSYRLDKLTTPLIQTHVNQWAKKANDEKVDSFKNYSFLASYIKRILQYGVTLQLIDYNPSRDVVIPRRKNKEKKPIKMLSDHELKQFLDYLETIDLSVYRNFYFYCLYKTLLATGCRIGELLALEWSDIDFEEATISISKTLTAKKTVNSPKTVSSNRIIDIDNATNLLLKQLQNRQRATTRELGYLEDVVFSPISQKYTRSATLSFRLKKDLQKAGVSDIGFHGFRHTHASLLLNAGIPYKELQHRLGHTTIAMTMDTYSHLSKENAKKAVSVFETAINQINH
ncbi:tyrosine-type recombinase/integrase [Streptococcus pluranimalium]